MFRSRLESVVVCFLFGSLQKIFYRSLIFSWKLSDVLNCSVVLDQQFEKMLEEKLQVIEVIVFNHMEQFLFGHFSHLLSLVG